MLSQGYFFFGTQKQRKQNIWLLFPPDFVFDSLRSDQKTSTIKLILYKQPSRLFLGETAEMFLHCLVNKVDAWRILAAVGDDGKKPILVDGVVLDFR